MVLYGYTYYLSRGEQLGRLGLEPRTTPINIPVLYRLS